MTEITFTPIPEALKHYAAGGVVIVMDDEDRENEGDLIIAAEHATPENIAFILRYTTGILCAPMLPDRAEQLALPSMVANNEDAKCTAFTVSCDYKYDISTGVSAADRALTFKKLADPEVTAEHFTRPGHVFPLCAKPNGIVERRGHTEAGVDLCRLSGLQPVAVIGELMDHADGTMMRLPACATFAKEHGLPLITIEAMEAYRKESGDVSCVASSTTERGDVYLAAECPLPVERKGQCLGMWRQMIFQNRKTAHKHVVLVKGDLQSRSPVPARVHSECFTGDLLGSRRCDCGQQLDQAFRVITQDGCGIIIYMGGHEGRGIGLVNKTRAYKLQMEQGFDTYEANEQLGLPQDMRSYDDAHEIFKLLNVDAVELLTNNPLKVKELESVVVRSRPLRCAANEHSAYYLAKKQELEASLRASLNVVHKMQPPKTCPLVEQPPRPEVPFVMPKPESKRTSALRIAVVRASWNGEFVQQLWDGVRATFLECGVQETNIKEEVVPGAYELPITAQYMATHTNVDAILVIAVLVQREAGDTTHFESAAQAVSQGIMQVQLNTSVPVLCGVLSCLSDEQVLKYVANPDEVPRSLAISTLQMAEMKRFRYSPGDITSG
jgi:3,4-dihydroxy 2-butanone 4-phosphate synthase/GTP cyclohydrolase II|eukprot:CAMPEP_0174286062 /NCGR_PEP_ID=MMETSP0809-20121228/10599_1 /TAXON_ID=73025 ORGANISM="Eutreptiella gymnastica-like, Strain CCMP1594" /NCGR_SAMPLE_ID=MMETSP0809 /ASSEMBLY_ACC=CAM_ASM_000658 /LENGTH=609 /DNA_ID=CAMNT_0015381995 /DNA_START=26 /DNA_END=1855 /DNA_ORIENTATION=+